MIGADLISIMVVFVLAAALAYRVSLLHDRVIGHFSLLQIIYLVVIPGILLGLNYFITKGDYLLNLVNLLADLFCVT